MYKHTAYFMLITIVVLGSAAFVYAAEEDKDLALKYYQQAEILFEHQQYEQALMWYRKALEYMHQDGTAIVEEISITKLVPYGRKLKEETVTQQVRHPYIPNERIKTITDYFENQKRAANPPKLKLRWMTLKEPTRDDVLDGGETGSIIMRLVNDGGSNAIGVVLHVETQDSEGLRFAPTIQVEDLAPGDEQVVELEITALRDISGKNRNFLIFAKEQHGYDSNKLDVVLKTNPHQPAVITVSDVRVDDLDKDSRIRPTEAVDVTVRLANTGKGMSDDIRARIKLHNENMILLPGSAPTLELGQIVPGHSKDFKFSFVTNHRFKNNEQIPLSIEVFEKDNLLHNIDSLNLVAYVPLDKQQIEIKPVVPPKVDNPFIVDVDTKIPLLNRDNPDAVAVIIGNRDYHFPGMPKVRYAINDAQVMKKYLMNMLGYKEANILYFENASSARFSELFGSEVNFAGRLYNYVSPNKSDVFIYYSGHGSPDVKSKNAYFLPVDVDPSYIGVSGFSLNTFFKNVSKIPAKSITIVLDTCFSGNSAGGSLLQNISPGSINVKMPSPQIQGAAIFTSTAPDQVSTWFHEKRHSLFTYYFLKGLRGLADANEDGILTTTELARYTLTNVQEESRRIIGMEQIPLLTQRREYVLVSYQDDNVSITYE